MKLKTVGLIEKIKILGKTEVKTYALFDTGAYRSSIDVRLASRAGLGPVVKMIKVKNPSLKQEFERPVVKAKIRIRGEEFDTNVSLQDRSHMSFPVIIGRNVLSGNFIVNVRKNEELFKKHGGKEITA